MMQQPNLSTVAAALCEWLYSLNIDPAVIKVILNTGDSDAAIRIHAAIAREMSSLTQYSTSTPIGDLSVVKMYRIEFRLESPVHQPK